MQIPLNEFEQVIDEKILKRGLTYFKGGAITDFSEISTGEYEAIVSGTEEYTVQLEVSNNTIVAHNCDCPYDMGPICKHVVAAIFYLQQNELELNHPNFTIPKKKKTKSISQQVKELLRAISHEELIEFVQKNSNKDKKFRNYFLASFGHLSQNQSKEFYQKQIHSILQTAAGRDGWIDWSDMKYVVNTTEPFIENAEKYLTNNNFENVFYISTALLEEMTEAFQYGDDSNGDLGYFVESAMELLSKLVQKKLPATLKQEIFEYCISSFNQKLFEGWGWHLGMLHIACELIEKESDADIILDCLDTVDGNYERELAQSFKLDLLREFKDKQVVERYINKHISNSSIRMKEIEKAFKSKNFEKVLQLSKDGIKCDEKDKPGLVKVWYNWLLKVAQSQKDTPKIIEFSRFLFIDNFHPEQDYYQILKDTIEDEKWYPFLEEIIKEITPKQRWTYTELIRKIYIKEEWWERLFLMLKQNISLENIEQNESYLSKDYSSELIELYSERIINYVEKYIGRNHYQTACRYLRRMKKLGGGKQVKDLIEMFRKQYPQRKALMDELSRV
ncbi:SWIM zinc finger family protein [Gelidibacter salicanalis]|uniref:SWIM zinc finger family protein n=1 Tax=Gelidibacter salicanalis TaxID=291193 RepID=A0A934KSQ2_9FLAO|nr:SWIM zinc finger family protein [Gelidibacter salicanalis]MBJ7880023.1 SWIM zinc finger family protein [Gelidibacter salicanalis]